MEEEMIVPIDFGRDIERLIKVIGVGGGGGNAVNHMYKEGIHDVTFVVCNTDKQALKRSPVPVKIQLGEGLGAGGDPEVARNAANKSMDKIKEMLSNGCGMVFITAGMGGGTGTGAGPVIAKTAKEMGILTVGIVTIPFRFEGNNQIDKALDGVDEMSKNVDALLVINNERLRKVYADLSLSNAFEKANDILSVSAKSIAEIITLDGEVNRDFNDVQSVLKDGGVAIMSIGYGEGENRVSKAIANALNSPLLNNNDIFNSKKVLFIITYNPSDEFMMSEMDEIDDFMSRFRKDVDTKWGLYTDDKLGNKVKFTILATGFGLKDIPEMEKVINDQEEKNAARREGYYDPLKKIDRKVNIYIFPQEALDDDDIINMVETTPTYKRTRGELTDIQAKSDVEEKDDSETTEDGNNSSEAGIITF